MRWLRPREKGKNSSRVKEGRKEGRKIRRPKEAHAIPDSGVIDWEVKR